MIEFHIKEKTRSLNESFRGDWRPRAAAAKRQRTKAMQACPKWPGGPLLVVRLTRVSPGTLDGDAVPAALKHIRDGVASRLLLDDASPLVEWEYHQAKGEAEVVVQIWRTWDAAPPLPVGRPVDRGRPMTVVADAGKSLRVVREPGEGQKRAPRPAYEAPRTHRTSPMATKAVIPSAEDAAVARAVLAAQEAEATFAPRPVPPCDHCGDPYRSECFDPAAPPGSVKCRKDVHCYRYDGHDGDCSARSPRACTT